MTKDTEKMLTDEELNMVNGGANKRCLSKAAIKKLCNKIEELDVDPNEKRTALNSVRMCFGNIKTLKEYFLSLSRVNHKWSEIYIYIQNLAYYDN